MKTWHKVALSLVTVGITATATIYGVRAFRRHLALKKKKQEEISDAEKKEKDTPAQADADSLNDQTKT